MKELGFKELGFMWLNGTLALFAILFIYVCYPDDFESSHGFTMFFLTLSVTVAFAWNFITSEVSFSIRFPITIYLLSIIACTFLQIGNEEHVLFCAWISIIGSTLLSVVVHIVLKSMITAEVESMKETPVPLEINSEIRFHHAELDTALATLATDIAFLQQHASIIGLEAVHKVEQVLEDLYNMCEHYQQIRVEHRHETEALIEALCIHAETTAEECKTKIDAYHATQIEKYTRKHLYEKQ